MRVWWAIGSVVAISSLAACHASGSRARDVAASLDVRVPAVALDRSAPPVLLDRALRDTIAWHRNEWVIPGAAFATFTCETRRVAWDGVARVDEDTPISAHSLFPLEYHAAPMIATAAIRLEAQGMLRLDAPLRELWPSAARRSPWYAEITLAQLLSYYPPIPAFYLGDSASRVPQFAAGNSSSAARRATAWFLRQQPDSIPLRWRGSFPSIVVATGILEQVTGKPIAAVLHDEVFAPLGLRASRVSRGRSAQGQPRGHFSSGDTLRYPGHAALERPRAFYEASELAISIQDYVTFLQAHPCAAQGKPNVLLTQAEALRLYGSTAPDAPTPLGWGSLNVEHDPIRIVHGGAAGFTGAGGFSKLTGRGALMLMNIDGLWATYATGWVWSELLGYEVELPRTRAQIPR